MSASLVGKCRNTVAMPTPATVATSSVEPSSPLAPKTASAAARIRSRLVRAFLRIGVPFGGVAITLSGV